MNDLGYGQLSNSNGHSSYNLGMQEIIDNLFSNISTTLAKDFIVSHFLSQSPQVLREDGHILITQSSSWTSCHI